MNLYFSTGGYKDLETKDAINQLKDAGIKNIELSGTMHSNNNVDFLSQNFKKINFQVHNYFPPPKDPIVLNLASYDDDVYNNNDKESNNIFKNI